MLDTFRARLSGYARISRRYRSTGKHRVRCRKRYQSIRRETVRQFVLRQTAYAPSEAIDHMISY